MKDRIKAHLKIKLEVKLNRSTLIIFKTMAEILR